MSFPSFLRARLTGLRPRLRLPRPTVRLRLSLWYAALFFLAGALLLTLNYFLIRDSFVVAPKNARIEVGVELGIPPEQLQPQPRPPGGRPPGDQDIMVGNIPLPTLLDAIERQVTNWSLRQLAIRSGVALAVMALLSLGMGWLLAGRMLRPLQAITSTARRLSDTTLKERIALQGPADELKELADTFDAMLARLDAAFTAQRDFVTNASHELRTPLAIIRAEIDVTLSDPGATPDDYRDMAIAIRDAVSRSDQLIDRLLFLARCEGTPAREPVDLATLAEQAADRYAPEADARELALELKLDTAVVRGDHVLLERMVANLVENAVRHNVTGGWLSIATGSEQHHASITVRNGGPAIPPADAERLFERFYRLDRSRSRSTGGFGLGLSIVKAVAEAHGGTAMISTPAEGGLEVTVRLPVDAAPTPAAEAAEPQTVPRRSQ